MGKRAMNFKSKASYKKWLGYGHATGAFEHSPGHTPVKIKGRAKKVKHS